MKELINKLCEELDAELVKDVDEKYHSDLRAGFRRELEERFKDCMIKPGKEDLALRGNLFFYRNLLSNSLPLEKLSNYIYDENLQQLNVLSLIALNLATDRFEKDVISDVNLVNKNRELMKSYYGKVKEFNRLRAYTIYSAAEADYEYACGITDDRSIRLSNRVEIPRKK